MEDIEKIGYWLREFGMPEENIENCVTQIAQDYGACRYLDGVAAGAEAVNELEKEGEASEDLEEEIHKEIIKLHTVPCYDELKAFALHFIEWQKKKMMKDAVETKKED
jgi:hypothetical protein